MTSPSAWLPMSSAPKDGTMILVCESPNGEVFNVMPASYQLSNEHPDLEGFWGVAPTSHQFIKALGRLPNNGGVQIGRWLDIACTPLCWQPLPAPEDEKILRRRAGQIYANKQKQRKGPQ